MLKKVAAYDENGNYNEAQIAPAQISENINTSDYSSQREIIIAADGTYTDKPANTYSTQNAVASARIYISE